MYGPSAAQMEKLVEYMERNPMLATGHMRGVNGRYHSKAKWEEMTTILNSMEGLQKDTKQWTRFWADKKYYIKRRLIAHRNAAAYNIRHGLNQTPLQLSELNARILLLTRLDKDSEWYIMKSESPAEIEVKPAKAPGPSTSRGFSTTASQTVSSAAPRRNPRVRAGPQRRQVKRRRQTLKKIEEKRVAAEIMQTLSLRKAVRALDHLTREVVLCGQTITEALNNLH